MIGHGHGLGVTLGLVIDAARPDRVHMTPVCFRLRRNFGIAIAFAGGSEEEFGVFGEREAECVVRAQRSDLKCLNGHFQIIDGAGRGSEVQHVIKRTSNVDVIGDVGARDAKARVLLEMGDIRVHAGNQVIE